MNKQKDVNIKERAVYEPSVVLLAHTPNPDKIVASSAKLCYSPVGVSEIAKNLIEDDAEKFLKTLVNIGHESPVEHVSFTFAIENVSRSLTHQLVRHRIASYSQQSQRYVKEQQFKYIVPQEISKSKIAKLEYIKHMEETQMKYDLIANQLILEDIVENYKGLLEKTILLHNDYWSLDLKNTDEELENLIESFNVYNPDFQEILHQMMEDESKLFLKIEKKAIENARYVLPNAAETKIVVTMNARSLLNFFSLRCCNRAQDEIRNLADKMLMEVKSVAPSLFKNAGAPCVRGICPEGAMSCGKPRKQ